MRFRRRTVRRRFGHTFEKESCFFGFAKLRGTLRIQAFHPLDLCSGQAGQAPNEVDQRPRLALAFRRPSAPGRHPGEPNTVFDDGEQLPIRQRLRSRPAHIGRWWIEAAAHRGVAASIVGVARRAVIRPMLEGAFQGRCRGLDRIGLISNGPRRRETPNRQGDPLFGHARAGARAKASARDGIDDDSACYCEHQEQDHKRFKKRLHHSFNARHGAFLHRTMFGEVASLKVVNRAPLRPLIQARDVSSAAWPTAQLLPLSPCR